MTYCVALKLDDGLVMLSDTRTNAGVDNISRFSKMFTWERTGEQAICLMCAGNLSITQGVVTLIDEALDRADAGEALETVFTEPSMFRVAMQIGRHMQTLQARYGQAFAAQGAASDATLLLAGQRAGEPPRLFMIYAAGNFIEATPETPFFQIGEHKYGKPILDRVIAPGTRLSDARKAVLLSMDSTIRSNLTVGPPLDLAVLPAGTQAFSERRRIEADDPEFGRLSARWSESLRHAFEDLPEIAEAPPEQREL